MTIRSCKRIQPIIKLRLLLLMTLGFLAFSCQVDNSSLMPNITGRAYEVVLVMEDQHWEGYAGDSIINALAIDMPALPQDEPIFDLVQIPPKAFSDIFKTHRNIIRVNISSSVNNSKVYIRKDVYARPQVFLQIDAKNVEDFIQVFEKHKDAISKHIMLSERNRIIGNYKRYEEVNIGTKLRSRHGLSLSIPRGYTYDMDTSQFIWMSHETRNVSQGILVYYYNYTDTAAFEKDNLIKKRDYMLKQFVHGENEGTYMATEMRLEPLYREFMMDEKYFAELRGLWRLENDFMGGPFVSLSTVDESRNRVVTVEGYVYGPKVDKRNFLRQVEAILYTLEFINQDDQ